MKSLLVVSTCGTSILANGADDETRQWLIQITNLKELSQTDASRLAKLVDSRRAESLAAPVNELNTLCAEFNAIRGCLERYQPDRVEHMLFESSTAVGIGAASLIEDLLRKTQNESVDRRRIAGLQTNDGASFRDALSAIVSQLEETVPGYRDSGYTIIFNLNGGFKAVSGFLQALGMIYADRCVFRFEGASELLEIPRLPLQLDDENAVRENLTTFRKIELGYEVDSSELAGIPETLWQPMDGRASLSLWGDVVWARFKNALLNERILAPLSPKLKLDRASRDIQKVEPARVRYVNEALDRLSAKLDLEREPPKSNTFKVLVGDPRPPSTHEMYLWSDGNASRLFGHYEQDCFFVDSLGPHLP